MLMQTKSGRLVLPVLLMVFVLTTMSVSAAEPYDVAVTSPSFEPNVAVTVHVAGYQNQTFSLRITNEVGDIVGGRDTQLNETGQAEFSWVPAQEGTYNVTVVFSTGVTIVKSFLIQRKVTEQDVAEIYAFILRIRDNLEATLADLTTKMTYIALVSSVALIVSIYMGIYMRKRVSPATSELEKFEMAIAESEMGKAVKKLLAENTELKKQADAKK